MIKDIQAKIVMINIILNQINIHIKYNSDYKNKKEQLQNYINMV